MCLTVFIINKEEGGDKIQAESKQTWRDVSHASLPSVWFLNKLKIKTIKSRSISLRTQMRSNQRCILCWHFSLQGVDLKQRGSSDFNPSLSAAACNLVLRMGGGHVLVLDIKFIRLAAREGWGRDICNQTRTSPIWWRRKGGGWGGGCKNKKNLYSCFTGAILHLNWVVTKRRMRG